MMLQTVVISLWCLLHAVVAQVDISGCCTHVRIETTGEAKNHQGNRVGEYRLTGVLADRPIYKNVDRDEFLFYLQSKNKGLWMVGPQAGQFNGGLAHRGDTYCVEDVTANQWKYTDGSAWHVDPHLRVSCLDETVTPQCLYNDQTEFRGGDLPDIFGGGGFETSMESSADCIEECEKRSGCNYWTWVMGEKINCFLKSSKVEAVRKPKFVSGSIPKACISTPATPTQAPSTYSVCTYKSLNFQGGDLFSVLAEDEDDCRQQCEAHVSCKLFSFRKDLERGCSFKTDQVRVVQDEGVVSGATAELCQDFILPHVTKKQEEPIYNENEVNGKFKITSLRWDEKLNDPNSQEYKDLSNTIEDSLETMLRSERDLDEQAEFSVKVQKFRQGSVVCDFKVNYILKEAYIAIPFAIKPSNITDAMSKNFKFKKGVLFQRFLIAAGSFNASAPVDHCAAKGCSHKCDYDYDQEDYVCTCPKSLVLDTAERICLSPEEAATEGSVTTTVDTASNTDLAILDDEKIITTLDPDVDQEETTTPPEIKLTLLPMDCLWAPWSDWSECSTSCGPGQRERHRTIVMAEKNGGECPGEFKEFTECEGLCEQIEEVESRDNQGEPVTSKDVQTKTDDEVLQSTKAVDVSVKTTTEAYVTEEIPDLEIDMPEEVINVDGDNVTDELTTTFPEEDILNETDFGEKIAPQGPTTEFIGNEETTEINLEATTPTLIKADEGDANEDEDTRIVFPLPENEDIDTTESISMETTTDNLSQGRDDLKETDDAVKMDITTEIVGVDDSSISGVTTMMPDDELVTEANEVSTEINDDIDEEIKAKTVAPTDNEATTLFEEDAEAFTSTIKSIESEEESSVKSGELEPEETTVKSGEEVIITTESAKQTVMTEDVDAKENFTEETNEVQDDIDESFKMADTETTTTIQDEEAKDVETVKENTTPLAKEVALEIATDKPMISSGDDVETVKENTTPLAEEVALEIARDKPELPSGDETLTTEQAIGQSEVVPETTTAALKTDVETKTEAITETEQLEDTVDTEQETTTTSLSGKEPRFDIEKENNAEDVTTVASPINTKSEEETSPVTLISIEETDEAVTIVTTAKPTILADADEKAILEAVTTLAPQNENSSEVSSNTGTVDSTTVATEQSDVEFLCKESKPGVEDSDIPLKCVLSNGENERTVVIVLSKESLGVTRDKLFDKNVKLIVKDFMLMERSPRNLS